MTTASIAVLGAGSWGTAIAKLLGDKGHRIKLWGRSESQTELIESVRENRRYLPNVRLPVTIEATCKLDHALTGSELTVLVTPTHAIREVLTAAAPHLAEHAPVVTATKGIENGTLMLVSEIFESLLPGRRIASLGGPSFAAEVARGIPTAVSVASHDEETAQLAQETFSTDRFRVYTTDDVAGVELGGALKNVIAIAAGIVDGLGFGHNTRAALITRGLAELTRLAVDMGAHPLTMAGLSGMGDLVLTCTGDLSRNRRVGIELGQGRALKDVLAGMTMVAEGVATTRSAWELAQKRSVEMPIVEQVYRVLYEGRMPKEAVVSLMTRPPRAERE